LSNQDHKAASKALEHYYDELEDNFKRAAIADVGSGTGFHPDMEEQQDAFELLSAWILTHETGALASSLEAALRLDVTEKVSLERFDEVEFY